MGTETSAGGRQEETAAELCGDAAEHVSAAAAPPEGAVSLPRKRGKKTPKVDLPELPVAYYVGDACPSCGAGGLVYGELQEDEQDLICGGCAAHHRLGGSPETERAKEERAKARAKVEAKAARTGRSVEELLAVEEPPRRPETAKKSKLAKAAEAAAEEGVLPPKGVRARQPKSKAQPSAAAVAATMGVTLIGAVVRLDRIRGVEGEGKATRVMTEASEPSKCTGWCATASVGEVRARGVQLSFQFLRGQAAAGDPKGTGKLSYLISPGRSYVAFSCSGRGKQAVKHYFGVEDDGLVTWCVDGQVLAEWAMKRAGRSYADEVAAAKKIADDIELADPLPPLSGSPGQVAWAVELRRAFVVRLPHRRDAACRRGDAKWWLDNADANGRLT
jgi:hypothetical protein